MERAGAEPRTVGLVGLGVIGRVHLGVIAVESRLTLSFTADPSVTLREAHSAPPQGAFEDLSAALRAIRRGDLAEPDLIVLATPTRTHLELAAQVLEETSIAVLSEKPLTGDAEELAEFERGQPRAAERLRVVNHFAFSPEVDWAAGFVARHGWGSPFMVLSTFNDPYVTKPPADRATYVSSWIDSGPNQLGLLARFVTGCVVRSHNPARDGMRSTTEVHYDGGSAVLASNWLTGDSSKQTALRWPDNREMLLDHTAMTAIALEGGKPVAHLGNTGTTDRKTAHYAAMYDAYLSDPASPLLSLAFARSTAELLHHATTSAPRGDAIDWHTTPG